MRKIIALYASANKGKTCTLNILIDLLSLVSSESNVWKTKEGWGWFKINDITVGVCTPGDDKSSIDSNINYFNKNECEVIVTAARTKGETIVELEKLEKKECCPILWFPKEDNEENNKLIASELFRLVLDEVDNINEWYAVTNNRDNRL